MNQKYKPVIAVILAIWIFAMGFILGEDNGVRKAQSTTVVQQDSNPQPQPTPDVPDRPDQNSGTNNGGASADTNNGANNGGASTDTNNGTNNGGASADTNNNGGASADANNGTSNGGTSADTNNGTNNGGAATTDPTQYTDDQVIEWINYYVNRIKSEQNMTAKKTESIKVTVLYCSVPSLTGTVNNIVDGLLGDGGEAFTYTITNGAVASTDDPEASTSDTPFSLIPPTNKQFVVSKEGIVDAKAEVDANGNVTYTVILAAEDTTLASPEPLYNSTAIGYLNLAGLDIPIAKINRADMHYPGSTVSVTVDANDKVIKLYNKLPMSGKGEASIAFATGTADFEGALDETWEFTY